MTVWQALETVLIKKYFTFSGRAARPEYWWYFLFSLITPIMFQFLMLVAPSGAATADTMVGFFMMIPAITVTWRRLHDVDLSGWWTVLPFVLGALGIVAMVIIEEQDWISTIMLYLAPAIAAYLLLLWQLALPGTPGPNRFGDDPLGARPEIFD